MSEEITENSVEDQEEQNNQEEERVSPDKVEEKKGQDYFGASPEIRASVDNSIQSFP